MSQHILIIDDEKSICQSLAGIFDDEGYETSSAHSAEDGIRMLEEEEPQAILLDVWLPGMDGLEALQRIKARHPALPVVMISGHGTVETAVKATRLGAYDFVEKPLDMDKILLTVRNALEHGRLAAEVHELRGRGPERPSGDSPAIREVMRKVEMVAPTDSWVLITGENGTGKELVARSIHRLSPRSSQPFVDVNCAAIPEELIESELFGHEKGAFTGAVARRRGKFDQAHKGTLFLDEIADMSLKTQAKILRILQEQRFERVGGASTITVDVRVLAATNKDLPAEIAAGRFREDLYYRLNVIPIHLPPLRERAGDLAILAQEFLGSMAQKFHIEPKRLTPAALAVLEDHAWPGNVRELRNLMERLTILAPGPAIDAADMTSYLQGQPKSGGGLPPELLADDFRQAKAAFERFYLERKLAQAGGNISQLAEQVGLERSSLSKKLKSMGLTADKSAD